MERLSLPVETMLLLWPVGERRLSFDLLRRASERHN